jgi:hypothetical protein
VYTVVPAEVAVKMAVVSGRAVVMGMVVGMVGFIEVTVFGMTVFAGVVALPVGRVVVSEIVCEEIAQYGMAVAGLVMGI